MPVLQLPHGDIHYVRSGSGAPALVFVHGALCTHEDWEFQLPHFAQRHQVVAPDLYGHGASTQTPGRIGVKSFAADVIDLCEALGLNKVVLIGHSMGCRVLLEIWRTAPQRVAALVCVDGAYLSAGLQGERSDAERAALATAARARLAGLYANVEPGERARHGFAQMFYDARFDDVRDKIVARAMRLPGHVARELMPDFAAWDALHLEQVLATVKVPLLAFACTFMNSASERVTLQTETRTPWLEALRTLAPHAEVIRYHGGGHFPMLEKPAAVNQAIDDFLQRHGLG